MNLRAILFGLSSDIREAGNQAFNEGDYDTAEQLYAIADAVLAAKESSKEFHRHD